MPLALQIEFKVPALSPPAPALGLTAALLPDQLLGLDALTRLRVQPQVQLGAQSRWVRHTVHAGRLKSFARAARQTPPAAHAYMQQY
jgi:hypothetical protein